MKAWHFMRRDRKLGYGDGRRMRRGVWLVHKGELSLRQSGLHASVDILDALDYAPGPIICRVELGGRIERGIDKCVAERRRVLWWVDGEKLLWKFAYMCAQQNENIRIDARVAPEVAARDAVWVVPWDDTKAVVRTKQRRRLLYLVNAERRSKR